MAFTTDLQYSKIIKTIISEVAALKCQQSQYEAHVELHNYFQPLKHQYNKKTLYKCLSGVIHLIDEMYYNNGTSPWNDQQYDCFVEYIKSNPDNYFDDALNVENIVNTNKVGAQVNEVATTAPAVKLPYFMASMNKYKTISEIKNWCRKFKGPYTISAKLDGISAMYYRGKLYTRGNGTTGRDISYLIPFLKQKLPDNNFECGFRGELIIRKSIFAQNYSENFANSRNLVCGLLNRVYCKENEQFYSNIDFIVYDVYHYNPLQFCNKIKIVNDYGSQMVIYKDNVNNTHMNNLQLLDSILKTWKTEYDYEIDGIIVTNDKPCIHSNDSNPDFAFAYKNNVIGVEMKEAIIEKVLWNISKDNYWKPKIKLTEKVHCDGSQVEYVTGFNAKYILQNNIKPGTVVKIGLSGNVIPHIFEIVNNGSDDNSDNDENWNWADLEHPITRKLLENIDCEDYNWNKNQVDLVSKKQENSASIIKQNMIFFNAFGIKCGLQETTLLNLHKSLGIYKLEDILSLSVEDWEKVEKVGNKKGQNIVNSLNETLDWNSYIENGNGVNEDVEIGNSKHESYFMKCLLGLQCFPRGFGKKKLECHMNYVKKVCKAIDKLHDLNYFEKLKPILVDKIEEYKTPQVTSDSIQLFCEGYSSFINEYNRIKTKTNHIEFPDLNVLLENIVTSAGSNGSSGGDDGDGGGGKNGNIVFSGVRDKNKEAEYVKKGYEISDSVNSKTKLLIVKDKNANTTKIKKARTIGIKIVSLNEL